MLTPDNRKRIKIREIFAHPWVLEMENETKDEMRKNIDENNISNTPKANESSKVLTRNQTQPILTSNILLFL